MNEKETGQVSEKPHLSVSEKLSIINALMEQDRIEIRERQEAVFRLTYLVVPGFIAFAAFYVDRPAFKTILVLALLLILAVYVVAFFIFRKWLHDSRACLQIRESFYMEQVLLYSDPFTPIRPINKTDRQKQSRFKDNALWFPFGITVFSAVVLLAYVLMT